MSMPLSAIHPEMYLWGCMRDERQPSANYDRDREYQRALFSALEKEEKRPKFLAYGGEYHVDFKSVKIHMIKIKKFFRR